MDKKSRKLSLAAPTTKIEPVTTENNPKGKMKLRTRHKLEAKNPFKPNQVYKILENVISEGVSQFYYNSHEAPKLCQELASQIRSKVKALNYDRIIVMGNSYHLSFCCWLRYDYLVRGILVKQEPHIPDGARYKCKLICVVDIVQKNLQGVRSICSFIWDPKRDHYAIYSYNKFDLLATAYVFGVYHN